MKLPAILCSDLHLTAHPDDEYRWALWPWLRQQCQRWQVESLAMLGDLTDAKDYHSSTLVNRVVREVKAASEAVLGRTYILKGNHDYLKTNEPFFGFLSALPRVHFINTPYDSSPEGEPTLWLPHTRTPAKDWAGFDLSHYRYVMLHQTLKGAVASNGQTMEGEELPDLSAAGKCWSGDIHVPQKLGPLEYVGSPYHVHFGDNFRPRCVLLHSNGDIQDLRFTALRRLTVNAGSLAELQALRLRQGDQIKLRLHMDRAALPNWQATRKQAREVLLAAGVGIHGIELVLPKVRRRVRQSEVRAAATSTPEEAMLAYVEREGLPASTYETGLELL